MKKELEKLEKNKSTIEDKLRIMAVKDEIKISESLVDEREVELTETTSNLLEALKAADINVDEEVPFHLHDNTYISVRRTGDDSIMLFGPYSRN